MLCCFLDGFECLIAPELVAIARAQVPARRLLGVFIAYASPVSLLAFDAVLFFYTDKHLYYLVEIVEIVAMLQTPCLLGRHIDGVEVVSFCLL